MSGLGNWKGCQHPFSWTATQTCLCKITHISLNFTQFVGTKGTNPISDKSSGRDGSDRKARDEKNSLFGEVFELFETPDRQCLFSAEMKRVNGGR